MNGAGKSAQDSWRVSIFFNIISIAFAPQGCVGISGVFRSISYTRGWYLGRVSCISEAGFFHALGSFPGQILSLPRLK